MSSTAELRWWFDGAPPGSLEHWFAEHAPDQADRSDRYLRLPGGAALGVKLRGGTAALELKLRTGEEPVGGLPGGAAGSAEVWQKWSFPVQPLGRLLPRLGLPSRCWRDVSKRRRTVTFPWSAEAGCRAELVLVSAEGRPACASLGLEAFGPDDLLRPALLASAEAVLSAAGPVAGLMPERSYGYPAWLDRLG